MTATPPGAAGRPPRDPTLLERLDGLHWGWRLGLGLPVTAALGFTGFFAFFVGGFATTGCFISCSEPRPVQGALALFVAGVATTFAVTALTWVMAPRRAHTTRFREKIAAGIVLGAALVSIANGVAGTATGPVVGVSAALVAATGGWHLRSVLATLVSSFADAAHDLPGAVRGALVTLAVLGDAIWVVNVARWSTCADGDGGCDVATLLGTEGLWLTGGWTAVAGAAVVVLTGNARRLRAWATAAGVAAVVGIAAVLV